MNSSFFHLYLWVSSAPLTGLPFKVTRPVTGENRTNSEEKVDIEKNIPARMISAFGHLNIIVHLISVH